MAGASQPTDLRPKGNGPAKPGGANPNGKRTPIMGIFIGLILVSAFPALAIVWILETARRWAERDDSPAPAPTRPVAQPAAADLVWADDPDDVPAWISSGKWAGR